MNLFLAVALKGLLLVTSDPAGASITYDGYMLGETPRLVTTLEVGKSYRLKLEKQGYQPCFANIFIKDRTPLEVKEKLLLDSGIVNIKTQPEGARVFVNGLERTGKTPVTVTGVPKGRASIELNLEGYYPVKRELVVKAAEAQDLEVSFEPKPGTLHLFGSPDGIRFYVNNVAYGGSPAKVTCLKPGPYFISAKCEGAETMTRTVTIAPGQSRMEEFRLTVSDTHHERPKPRSVIDDQLEGNMRVRVKTDTGVFVGILKRQDANSVTLELPGGISRSFPRAILKGKGVELLSVE